MINCDDILVFAAGDFIVEWEGYGQIDGFADGSDSVSIELDGSADVTFKASADGTSGTLNVNNKTDGVAMLKLAAGSAHLGALRRSFLRNKARRGALSITSTSTGESYNFGCAGLQKMINFASGSEAADSYDIPFWFSSLDYTLPRGARGLDSASS